MILTGSFTRVATLNDFDQKVINAALWARKEARCIVGECVTISATTAQVLRSKGISARLTGSGFVTHLKRNIGYDHAWVLVGDKILDPTIDQFAAALDVDLKTVVPGIYYSPIDGGFLDDRYKYRRQDWI